MRYTGEKIAISAKEQRDFTTKYVIAFTNDIILKKPLHKIANSSDQKLFGYKAMVSNSLARSHDHTVTSNRATLEQVISSNMMNKNTAGLFNPGGFSQNLELLKISWQEQGANVAFALSKETRDLSKRRFCWQWLDWLCLDYRCFDYFFRSLDINNHEFF